MGVNLEEQAAEEIVLLVLVDLQPKKLNQPSLVCHLLAD